MSHFNATTLQKAMEDNMRQKFSYLADRLISMQVHRREEGLQYIDSGLKSDTFNTVFGAPSPDNVSPVTSYYYPAAWWLSSSVATAQTERLLHDQKWNFEECDIGMYLLMENASLLKASSILQIRLCLTSCEYQDFGKVLASIFEPLEAKNVSLIYNQLAQFEKDSFPNMDLLLGYEEDQPVSTVSLFYTDKIAGIFDLATHPEKRNRGYGRALFSAAVHRAKQRGAECCILQASPQGMNIYADFGFKPLSAFHVWSNKST